MPDTTFDVVERDADSGFINFLEGPDGRIYVSSGRDAAVMTRQADGTYTTDRQLFSRFSADRTGAFYAEKNGVLWFGTGGLLARFDTTRFERSTPPFSALVRRITVNQSSLVSPSPAGDGSPSLAAGSRSIRFEFAAPSFLNERTTEYQSRLDGLDAGLVGLVAPSRDATTRTSAFGDYRFHVRARNELESGERRRRRTPSPSCRRGTARGGRTPATCWRSSGSSSAPTVSSGGA